MSWKDSAIEQQVALTSDDAGTAEKKPGRRWTRRILYCVWSASGVFVANIILTVVAVSLAYSKDGAGQFGYAPIYQGKCSVAKNSATGIHLVINILSTIMLGASNYCMQCLAAPSRAEVDEAHQKRSWLAIGIPDLAHLVFHAPARRRWLGVILLVTSFPIHLIYNSAAYYSMQPQQYGVSVVNDIQALKDLDSAHLRLDYGSCFGEYTSMNASELQQVIREERYEHLDKKDCIDRFAQDYLLGQKALIVVTNTSMSSDVPLIYVDSGNSAMDFTSPYTTAYQWMCSSLSSCSASTLRANVDDWTIEAYRWFPMRLMYDLYGVDLEEDSGSNFQCFVPGASMDTQMPAFQVDHCLSIAAEESCQLVFLPPVCLIVLFCNAVKLVCMVLAARESREDVFFNIGDAVASFLTVPDPATESAGLLSKDAAKKGAQGWHRASSIFRRHPPSLPPTDIPPANAQHLPPRKRWAQAVSKTRWLCILVLFTSIIAPASYLLSLGIKNVTKTYTSSIWSQGLGQPRSGTIITGLNFTRTFPNVLALILLSNTPQLLVTIAYFLYNACLTCMLAAVEYDSYASSQRKRKYLRVSWPRGNQRSTHYLSLPYRYSLPLLGASAVLHWLVSQSLFYVEIIALSMDPVKDGDTPILTCGFSPVAVIFAIALGATLLLVAAALGSRRFASRMPVIGYCSAAISAACHPGVDGVQDHAMQPIRWGEVSSPEFGTETGTPRGTDDSDGDGDDRLLGIEMGSLDSKVYHCSFTSGAVVEPRPGRLYI
ncbi:hypothetical protein BJX76DRAFT_363367 [Aspergillus varians]